MSKVGSNLATLFAKECRLLVRDRQAAGLLFAMPAVFVFLLSLALADMYDRKSSASLVLAILNEDSGAHSARLVELLSARDQVQLVPWDGGESALELFRAKHARAAVRIPDGFSIALEELFGAVKQDPRQDPRDGQIPTEPRALDLGDRRIEWAVAPSADPVYPAIVRASLVLAYVQLVQEEVARGTAEMTGELTREMGNMARKLQRLAASLQDTVGQLESTASQLSGSAEDVRAFAVAAAAEKEARAEAERIRARMGEEALLAGPSGAVEARPIGVEAPSIEVLGEDERRDLERLLGLADSPSELGTGPFSQEIDEHALLVAVVDERGKTVVPDPLQQNVPGWSLFAMFFIVVPLSSLQHRERSEGTTRRLVSFGVPRGVILLGRFIPYVLVGCLQFVAMVLVGMYLVPLVSGVGFELGPNPWGLVPVTLVCAFTATAYGLFVATAARTPEQAAAFGASSVVILSALGGIMIPHFVMPPFLQQAAHASPIFWGHQAYLDVLLQGATLGDLALPLGILMGFGTVCLLASARRAVA